MKLARKLGALDVFALAAGSMISSGLFILPGLAYAKSGPAVILSYILASFLMVPALFSQIELVTAMPKAGGTYFFVERSLGPFAGLLSGLANWFSISLKSAFALIGIGAFYVILKPNASIYEIKMIAVIATVFFMIINMVSVESAGKFESFLVAFLLGILGYYVIFGVRKMNVHFFVPFFPHGDWSVFRTVGMIFISFGGLTTVASMGEEVHNPGKNIPLGMFLAFFIVSLIYALVVFVTVGLIPGKELMVSLVPLSQGGKVLGGIVGETLLTIAAMFAFISTANAGIMSASRAPFAMSRDKLMPKFFFYVNKKFKTPLFAILFTGLFIIAVIVLLELETLVKTASALMIVLFMFVNLAVIIMRESKLQSYRPLFKSFGYPYIQVLSIIIYAFLIIELGIVPLLITCGFAVVGILWYFLFVRQRAKSQYALINLVERITDKKIVDDSLSDELSSILFERDNIIEDRFDKIIKQSLIFDINKLMEYTDFFEEISTKLESKLKLSKKQIYNLFMKREKESSTVIHPGLAIPHIVVPGKQQFEIVLVRNKVGIHFPNTDTLVKTVFILLGTKDERNFHLRALMAIAQIAQNPKFEMLWLEARNLKELRNLILLSNRTRDRVK